MSENNNNPNSNPTNIEDTVDDNVIEYTRSTPTHHHKRKHSKRFTKPMLFSWILLLLLLAVCGVALFIVPIDNETKIVSIAVIVVVLVITAIVTFRKYHSKGRKAIIAMNLIPSCLIILVGILGVLLLADVSSLKQQASTMKSDLKSAAEYIKNEDIANARSSITTLDNDIDSIQTTLNKPTWKVAQYIPIVGNQISSVNKVVSAADTASTTIMTPLVDLLEQQPLSTLKVDDGFNVTMINSYITFMDGVYPTIKDMNTSLKNVDVSLTGMQDEIDEYLTILNGFVGGYDKYVPAIKSIIGDGTTYRQYMFMAQNLAEGRSMGGFVGSMSIVTVQDGVLRLGDFGKIYDFIPASGIPASVSITDEEHALFLDYMTNNWDANYTPDFSRAAEIWTAAYEELQSTSVDGVFSMTPTIIQKILASFETNITLSDGTYLDASNTMKTLSHDLYYKYLGDDTSEGNDICDALFSETANSAMDILVSNFSFSNIQKYMDIFNDSIEEGTFCVWMKDEIEESYIISAGIDGNLNNGNTDNVTGLYWNYYAANKMGWFMDLNTSISEGTKNSDGTYSYTVTATITNIFTDEDYNGAGNYILGLYNGNLEGLLHLFAPNGGTISDITTDNGVAFSEGSYKGLQVFYNTDVVIAPQTSMTITYKVTTATGVTDPLRLRSTPTLTNYR